MPPFAVFGLFSSARCLLITFLFFWLQAHRDSRSLDWAVHTHVGGIKLKPINFANGSVNSSTRIPKSIIFRAPNFPTFSPGDSRRLKETDSWLSDTHLAFSLMFVSFLFFSCFHPHKTQALVSWMQGETIMGRFEDSSPRYFVLASGDRGSQSIHWAIPSQGEFVGSWLCCDADVWEVWKFTHQGSLEAGDHWKTWRIYGGQYVSNSFKIPVMKLRTYFRTFHILDSWTNKSQSRREVRELQHILLQLAPGVFVEGRIALNHVQVASSLFDIHSFIHLN